MIVSGMAASRQQRERFGAELRALRGTRTLDQIHKTLLLDHGLDASVSKLSGWERGDYAPSQREIVDTLDAALGAEGRLLAALGHGDEPALTIEHRQTLDDRLTSLEERFSRIEALLLQSDTEPVHKP